MAAPARAAVASAVLTGMADEITDGIRDTDCDSLYTLSLAIMAAATSKLVRALAPGGRVPRRTAGFGTTGIRQANCELREIEDAAPSIASPVSNEAT